MGGKARRERNTAFFEAYDALLARWPVSTDSVDVPSVYGTTRVQVCGSQSAPPVVLLHGGGATSTVWFSTMSELARTHRVYALDLIGDPGRSVHDGRRLGGVSDCMSWLDGVLDHLGLHVAALCGHSYGGWLALNYALHAPHRVRRLALLAPTACFAGMRPSYRLRAVPLLAAPNADRMRAFVRWETGGRSLDPGWLEVVARGAAGRWSSPVLPRRPAADRIRNLQVPLLLVLAEHDSSHDNRQVERTARRLLSHLRVVTLPGATHHTIPNEEGMPLASELRTFFG